MHTDKIPAVFVGKSMPADISPTDPYIGSAIRAYDYAFLARKTGLAADDPRRNRSYIDIARGFAAWSAHPDEDDVIGPGLGVGQGVLVVWLLRGLHRSMVTGPPGQVMAKFLRRNGFPAAEEAKGMVDPGEVMTIATDILTAVAVPLLVTAGVSELYESPPPFTMATAIGTYKAPNIHRVVITRQRAWDYPEPPK